MPGGFGGGGGGSGAAAETKQEAAPEPVKEKEIFDIKIGAVDAKAKIKVIKEVRAITGLGLKEVCEIVPSSVVLLIFFSVGKRISGESSCCSQGRR